MARASSSRMRLEAAKKSPLDDASPMIQVRRCFGERRASASSQREALQALKQPASLWSDDVSSLPPPRNRGDDDAYSWATSPQQDDKKTVKTLAKLLSSPARLARESLMIRPSTHHASTARDAAFCNRVFSSPGAPATFLTETKHQQQDDDKKTLVSQQQQPLRFVERPRRVPPARLTYSQVPRGADSLFPYCGACVFADATRCAYCLSSKLSRAHRLALPRLATLLLVVQPTLSAKDMAATLGKYARNDEFCSQVNELVGWEPLSRALCGEHSSELAELEREEDEKARVAEALASRLQEAEATAAKALSRLSAISRDADSLRSAHRAVQAENLELLAMRRRHEHELQVFRDQSTAQDAVARCLADELDGFRYKMQHSIETGVQASPDAHMLSEASVHTQTCCSGDGGTEAPRGAARTATIATQTDALPTAKERRNSRRASLRERRRSSAESAAAAQAIAAAIEQRQPEASPPTTTTTEQHPPQQPKRRPSSTAQLINLSKIGAGKRFAAAAADGSGSKLIALGTLMDMVHEVMEKKVQNTHSALAAGKAADSLVDYVKVFWREKLGLRKLANKKMGEMIRAVRAYAKQHSRVAWFAVMLGVQTAKIDTGEEILDAPWVPWIPDSAFELLSDIFCGRPTAARANQTHHQGSTTLLHSQAAAAPLSPGGVLQQQGAALETSSSTTTTMSPPSASPPSAMVAPTTTNPLGLFELLAHYKKDGCVVDRARVVNAIIGSRGVLDHTVKLSDPSTWRPGSILDMMRPGAVRKLVDEVITMPEIEAVPEAPGLSGTPQQKGISLDRLLDLLLAHQVKATVEHQRALTAAFHRFDGGEPGLDINEFSLLLDWALRRGPAKPSRDDDGASRTPVRGDPSSSPRAAAVVDDDTKALYAKIESLADANLIDNENDKNINDSITFPVVIMQQVHTCPLAFARNCRRWWTLDDYDRPTPAGSMPSNPAFPRKSSPPPALGGAQPHDDSPAAAPA